MKNVLFKFFSFYNLDSPNNSAKSSRWSVAQVGSIDEKTEISLDCPFRMNLPMSIVCYEEPQGSFCSHGQPTGFDLPL